MSLRTPKQLQDVFAEKYTNTNAWWDASGLTSALNQFSTLMANLRSAGMDVNVDITGNASEMAFKLFEKASIIVPVTGTLRVGGSTRLFAFCVSRNDKPCLTLGLSKFDIRFNGASAKIEEGRLLNVVRAEHYNLHSPDSWNKLEEDILTTCAREALITQADTMTSFNTQSARKSLMLSKPALDGTQHGNAPPTNPPGRS